MGPLLKTLDNTVVVLAVFFGVVRCGSSISAAERKKLDIVIEKASSVLGCPLDTVEAVSERKMRTKSSTL